MQIFKIKTDKRLYSANAVYQTRNPTRLSSSFHFVYLIKKCLKRTRNKKVFPVYKDDL